MTASGLSSVITSHTQVLGRVAQRTDVSDRDRAAAAPNQPASKQHAEAIARLAAVRDGALKCLTTFLATISAWAAPLREAAAAAATTHATAADGGAAVDGDGATGGADEGNREVERLEAVWAHKSSLAKGMALFNTRPIKGLKFWISHGLVDKDPQVREGSSAVSC